MTISRWKVMAGVLGVSIGGLAAIAGQSQKPEATKTLRTAEPPPVLETPKVPHGGTPGTPVAPGTKPSSGPSVPQFDLPPSLDLPAAPTAALPQVPPPPKGTGSKPAKDLSVPIVPQAEAKPPILSKPEPVSPGAIAPPNSSAPVVANGPGAIILTPGSSGVIEPPMPGKPITPTSATVITPVEKEIGYSKSAPVEGVKPVMPPSSPAFTNVPSAPELAPSFEPKPAFAAPVVGNPTTTTTSPAFATAPSVASTVAPALTTVQTKFRIVLRVGEGDPMFEVRHGDDLVMKVMCEKVDIKSPEKGQGLSAVNAAGKVRFVGFGAEGTCENLSFLAGTGEVQMSGSVKVQVKDKIGRVESELTTDKMNYKLDSNSMPGVLKP